MGGCPTYPGVHLDQLFIKRGTSAYTIGSPSGSETDNLNLSSSESVAVGDVVGAIHRYNIDGSPVFVLTKTELWNRSGKSMLVHFGLTHSILSPDATPSSAYRPDQDADAGTTDVFFENPLGDPLPTAEGPETGLTIGIGRCSYQSSNGAYDGTSWSALTEPVASCDPDGMTEDLPFTFQTSATTQYPAAAASTGASSSRWGRTSGSRWTSGTTTSLVCVPTCTISLRVRWDSGTARLEHWAPSPHRRRSSAS